MTGQKRKFKGVWIPAEAWLNRSLSITDKVMLVEIDSLETEERGCYASNAHFAEFFGLSISRVSEIISGLADKGWIRVEQIREGKRIIERRIRLNAPFGKPNTPSENAANPFGKGGEPPSEKAKGSNTKENNTENSLDIFDQAWAEYPGRAGGNSKSAAMKAWNARINKDGVDPVAMLEGVRRYAAYIRSEGKEKSPFVKQAATFFGPNEHYLEAYEITRAAKPKPTHTGFSEKTYVGTPDHEIDWAHDACA